MRDEAPLWFNERHDFWALSRFADVEAAMKDWDTYRSGKGSTLDFIKSGMELPPGNILMEDPPSHDVHRGLMSRVFTPKRMNALEDKVRAFCARSLDPLVGTGGSTSCRTSARRCRCARSACSSASPSRTRRRSATASTRASRSPRTASRADEAVFRGEQFGEYVDWREDHPSDDLMTELIHSEFTDETGTVRTLTREEVLTYIMLIAGAGNETATRLIGWTGKLLAEHPDQRREIVEDRSLVPGAVEEILRYEAPSPVQARVLSRDVERARAAGRRGEHHGAAQRVGEPGRPSVP